MHTPAIRDRVFAAAAAADTLGDAQHVVDLTVEALGAACPHGIVTAFLRGPAGEDMIGSAYTDRVHAKSIRPPAERPMPWIINLESVPAWQRNSWVEPISAGVHGPGFFSSDNPVMQMIGMRCAPDYGRVMVCHAGRMVAWAGVYIDAARGFRDDERAELARIAASLARPLEVAALLHAGAGPAALAPRQAQILERVSSGWSNKRIAKDLDISPATVKTLLERLYRMSGAANRTALAAWWRGGGTQDWQGRQVRL